MTAGRTPSALNAHPTATDEQVAEVRKLCTPQLNEAELPILTDELVRRYYKGLGGDLPLITKRLVATAQWRHKEKPQHQTCACCAKNVRAHYMHPAGHDLHGRPVLFSSFSMIEDAAAVGATQHMLVEFERACRLMSPRVESWVWIMDFRGFGRRFSDLSPTLPLNFLHLSSNHYVERLGALWIIDAPSVMTPLWNLIKPLMDAVTHAKFKFIPFDPPGDPHPVYLPPSTPHLPMSIAPSSSSKNMGAVPDHTPPHVPPSSSSPSISMPASGSKLWSELCALCDEELAYWLLTEIRHTRTWDEQNRKKKAPPNTTPPLRPTWDLELLRKAVAAQEPLTASLPHQPDGHCHYGTTSLLALLQKQPDVLQLPPVAE